MRECRPGCVNGPFGDSRAQVIWRQGVDIDHIGVGTLSSEEAEFPYLGRRYPHSRSIRRNVLDVTLHPDIGVA